MRHRNLLYKQGVKKKVKGFVGYVLGLFLPYKLANIKRNRFTIRTGLPSRLDDWLIEGIRWELAETNRACIVDDIHKSFWSHDSAIVFHERHIHRFEKIYLRYFQGVVQFLADFLQQDAVMQNKVVADNVVWVEQYQHGSYDQLVEIGTGSGQVLKDLALKLPTVHNFTGLDLSHEQIERNRVQNPDSRLAFFAADAYEWIFKQGQANTIFFTHNGVLEYFSQAKLREMFEHINRQLAPALFTIIEPIADDFDLTMQTDSRPFDSEFSFSHNYPYLFKSAGWAIVFQQEVQTDDSRILMLVAKTT